MPPTGYKRRQVRKWLTREFMNTPYWLLILAAIAFLAIAAVILANT